MSAPGGRSSDSGGIISAPGGRASDSSGRASDRALRVLMLDDSAADAELVGRELRRRGLKHEPLWVRTREELERALDEFRPDVVLADYSLPAFSGFTALEIVRHSLPDVPCIFVSGSMGEERAVEALKKGATDYVLKGQLARLVPAVQRAVREAEEKAERRRLEMQFLQAQKMEAVGLLAGGIAHDFNNLLMVIAGYVDLALSELTPGDPVREHLEEVRVAGERAASLTHQLLAFSRKQLISPRVLDMNAVVSNMDKLLRRVLGEDIDLVTSLSSGLGSVKVDPGQFEQVLMNLAVNARDAMPRGGRLTIETSSVDVGEEHRLRALGLQPGRHVAVSVKDTGTGMDEQTLQHAFEPFFTTKGEGKGTGLGLATVYGIVRQSGGAITADSAPGKGTTFTIHLPVAEAPAPVEAQEAVHRVPAGGFETILLVEDNDQLRHLAARILRKLGYGVFEAQHPDDALAICRNERSRLDLLVTDVVMPDMNGRDLAEKAKAICGRLEVLYMSGYTENAVVRQGVLDQGIRFLQKPFLPDDLARAVREVLDERA